MTELESGIQNAIRDYLRWQGWYVVKIHQRRGICGRAERRGCGAVFEGACGDTCQNQTVEA